RARDIVVAVLLERQEETSPLSDDWLPQELDSIYVTAYLGGRLRGCKGSVIRSLDRDLRTLALAALSDDRFASTKIGDDGFDAASGVAVTVSLLFNPLELGEYTPEEVVSPLRHGQQALIVYQDQRAGLLLPFVASMYNLGPAAFVAEVIDKAGITRPPYRWCRFECSTWLADSGGVRITEGGFPQIPAPASLEALLPGLA